MIFFGCLLCVKSKMRIVDLYLDRYGFSNELFEDI